MATVLTSTDRHKMNDSAIFGQAVFAILRKIKREATPHTKPTQVASHFILPQRTQTMQCMAEAKNENTFHDSLTL